MTVVVVVGGRAFPKAELARHSTDPAGQPLSPTRCVASGRKRLLSRRRGAKDITFMFCASEAIAGASGCSAHDFASALHPRRRSGRAGRKKCVRYS